MINASDLAVLVLSCDKYADLWDPFLRQLHRTVPVQGFKIYFGTNQIPCTFPGVVPVLSGPDADWSSSCRRILEQIPERKLLVFVEDLFPSTVADPNRFQEAVDFVLSADANHLKYWAAPPTDGPSGHPAFGMYARRAPYRATVCGFWDRECLLRLLLDGENPWNFEIMGSYRTSYLDGFFGVPTSIFEFQNLVEKGYWLPQSVAWAHAEGISLDLGRRPFSEGGHQLVSRLKMAWFQSMLKVPWARRVKWMNALRKALISY